MRNVAFIQICYCNVTHKIKRWRLNGWIFWQFNRNLLWESTAASFREFSTDWKLESAQVLSVFWDQLISLFLFFLQIKVIQQLLSTEINLYICLSILQHCVHTNSSTSYVARGSLSSSGKICTTLLCKYILLKTDHSKWLKTSQQHQKKSI